MAAAQIFLSDGFVTVFCLASQHKTVYTIAMKRIKSIMLCLLMLMGCTPSPALGGMDVYAFSIGKADCHLFSFDGAHVLIDAGEADDGEDIADALKYLGIDKLDLVILTHFDKDHIGGFAELCSSVDVAKVIMPDYVRDSKQYRAMMAAIEGYNIPVTRLSADAAETIKGTTFEIWASTQVYDTEKGNDNELSLITAVTYGNVRMLYMGDAQDSWLNDLCYKGYDLSCDVLKFPYHGKWQKEVPALLALSLPKYAIITDSNKNPMAEETEQALKTLDIEILSTSVDNVHLFIDGSTVTVQ